MLASGVLVALALLPGLPTVPFLLMGGGLGAVAWRMRQKTADEAADSTVAAAKAKENLEGLLKVEPLSVEVGLGLVNLVERGARVALLHARGGHPPAARDAAWLPDAAGESEGQHRPAVARICDPDARHAKSRALSCCKAMNWLFPAEIPILRCKENRPRDPAFGLPAIWIRQDQVDRARSSGYTVVDAVSMIGTHLTEMVRRHAHELFTRQDAKTILRPRRAGESQGHRGFGPETAIPSHDPTSDPEHAAGTGADPRRAWEFWRPWEKPRTAARTRCC